jgi:hypothetical protein
MSNEYVYFKIENLNETKDLNELTLFENKKFIFCLFYPLKASKSKVNK